MSTENMFPKSIFHNIEFLCIARTTVGDLNMPKPSASVGNSHCGMYVDFSLLEAANFPNH